MSDRPRPFRGRPVGPGRQPAGGRVRVYTKTGDDGTTGLFGGGRTGKQSMRVEAYGSVDELNALVGLARALRTPPATGDELEALLARIQNDLFEVGADLAT